MKAIERIVVGVDLSEHDDLAIDAAVELAKRFHAELHLLHALDTRIPVMAPYEVVIPAAVIEGARSAATAKLETLLEKVATEGMTASAHLKDAPAAWAIVDLAGEIGADLIVLGTRGHTGLVHALLGSVAERTLRHAPCSVLTVKEPRI
jgi:nucleotide-binding universal stress UspA family protein